MDASLVYLSESKPSAVITEALPDEALYITPEKYISQSKDGAIITTYDLLVLEPETRSSLYKQLQTSTYALVLPPLPESGSDNPIPGPNETKFKIRSSKADHIRVGNALISDAPEQRFDIGTLGYFTTYSGRDLGKDSKRKPVIVEFQPRSTGGGIVMTTIALNTVAVTGNEQHRQDLLNILVEYIINSTNEIVRESSVTDEVNDLQETKEETISERLFDAGLLALYYYIQSTRDVELSNKLPAKALPQSIQVEFTQTEWKAFEQRALNSGIITDSGIDRELVEKYIDQRQLRSFARRLSL